MPRQTWKLIVLAAILGFPAAGLADPVHAEIDRLILARGEGKPASPPSSDSEFLRRIYLDLAGRIPTIEEARAFLSDPSADRRVKIIDRLLEGPEYPRRMADLFHVMLMERLGDHPEWSRWLHDSFKANKPWDQMAREILRGDAGDPAARGAVFFYAKRLENYGQNPVDHPGLTRDVGRLFLGIDLQCARCHNHMFVKSYKQADFQGLHVFFQNMYLADAKMPQVGERPTTQKLTFQSVFNKQPKQTGPRIPGMEEIEIPAIAKGKEYVKPPDNRTKAPGVLQFSPLAKLAEQLPTAENPAFSRNIVNRLWWAMIGRGLVHPLDLHHDANPPSHPEVLDLLSKEFVEHKFDVRWLVRELALSQTYQRSTRLPKVGDAPPPESFLAGLERRLSAEQLMASMIAATGEKIAPGAALEAVRIKFVKAFANPRREPEDSFNPSLKATLFVLNDDTILGWLQPKPGNLVDRLSKLDDAAAIAEEAYLSVLTRRPADAEITEAAGYLERNGGERRTRALSNLVWALLASTEFSVNH